MLRGGCGDGGGVQIALNKLIKIQLAQCSQIVINYAFIFLLFFFILEIHSLYAYRPYVCVYIVEMWHFQNISFPLN